MVGVDRYSILKSLVLLAYYNLLHSFGMGGVQFKIISFNVVTPVVKWWYFSKRLPSKSPALSDDKLIQTWLFSVISDAFMSFYYLQVCIGSGRVMLLQMTLGLSVLALEMLQHHLLYPSTEYKIHYNGDPWNLLAVPLAIFPVYLVHQTVDLESMPIDSLYLFPVFIVLLMMCDLVFSCGHYLCHCIPWMYKRHLIHHQYKKEALNAFATFHADIVDAATMLGSVLPGALLVRYVLGKGTYYVAFMESFYALSAVHLRYVEHQSNLMYFFEWDVIDMILGKSRTGCYHADHHQFTDRNFSVFGLVSDETLQSWFPSCKVRSMKSK